MTPKLPATAVRLQPLPPLNASREARRLGHSSRPHLGLTPPSSPSPPCQLPAPRPTTLTASQISPQPTNEIDTASTLLDSTNPHLSLIWATFHSGASPRLSPRRSPCPFTAPSHTSLVCALAPTTHRALGGSARVCSSPSVGAVMAQEKRGGNTSHGLFS